MSNISNKPAATKKRSRVSRRKRRSKVHQESDRLSADVDGNNNDNKQVKDECRKCYGYIELLESSIEEVGNKVNNLVQLTTLNQMYANQRNASLTDTIDFNKLTLDDIVTISNILVNQLFSWF